jgi:hypothetical protein
MFTIIYQNQHKKMVYLNTDEYTKMSSPKQHYTLPKLERQVAVRLEDLNTDWNVQLQDEQDIFVLDISEEEEKQVDTIPIEKPTFKY